MVDNSVAKWCRIGLLDLSVTPIDAAVAARIAANPSGKRLFLNHNLHSAYLIDEDEDFRRLYDIADWVVVDGAPILWLASLSSRKWLQSSFRITSTDWIDSLCELPTARRLFVFGATPDSNASAVERLRSKLTGWSIAGVDGYVSDAVAVKSISDFGPDLVIVGLGMPRQEKFLLRNLGRLPDATYATVGGAIDYLAGVTSLAPRWLGRLGLEWAWRLANEPRRLGHRYFVEPVLLIRRVFARIVRKR